MEPAWRTGRHYVAMKRSPGSPAVASPAQLEPSTELVVVARNQQSTLEQSVIRLHKFLSTAYPDRFPGEWTVTIADVASSDDTLAVAGNLTQDLSSVTVRHIATDADYKSLRNLWSTSSAIVVAFLSIDESTDLNALISPLVTYVSSASAPPPAVDVSNNVHRLFDRRSALAAMGGAGLIVFLAASGSSAKTTATPEATTSTGATTSDVATSSTTAIAATMPSSTVPSTTLPPGNGGGGGGGNPPAGGGGAGSPLPPGGGGGTANGKGDGTTFCRGTQLTDASGDLTFTTVYPGWYKGRADHMHVKVHVGGKEIHTGQIFFDDAITDAVYAANLPYSTRGTRDLRNADDGIFGQGGSATVITPTKSTNGYSASLAMGVQTA